MQVKKKGKTNFHANVKLLSIHSDLATITIVNLQEEY